MQRFLEIDDLCELPYALWLSDMDEEKPSLIRGPGGLIVQGIAAPDAAAAADEVADAHTHTDAHEVTDAERAEHAADVHAHSDEVSALDAPVPGASTLARIMAEEKRRASLEGVAQHTQNAAEHDHAQPQQQEVVQPEDNTANADDEAGATLQTIPAHGSADDGAADAEPESSPAALVAEASPPPQPAPAVVAPAAPAPVPRRSKAEEAEAELARLAEISRQQEAQISTVKQQLVEMHSRIVDAEASRVASPDASASRSPRADGDAYARVPSGGSLHSGSPRTTARRTEGAPVSPGRNVSPKDIDAYLRGQGLPAEPRTYLRSGAGVAGGRRGSASGTPPPPVSPEEIRALMQGTVSTPPPSPAQRVDEDGGFEPTPVDGQPRARRRSIAEQKYAHVAPKVDTRRRSVVQAEEAAQEVQVVPEHVLKAGTGHGGGITRLASRAGFKADYGARYSQGGNPGGARIWMPGNVDLPAEYGLAALDEEAEVEDIAADAAFKSRNPTDAYIQYAERLRSLRLRDGGGLVQMLGIDLEEANTAIQRTVEETAASRRERAAMLTLRRELHLIITGPAYGIDVAPAPSVEGEISLEEAQTVLSSGTGRSLTQPVRWSNTVVHGISHVSPFQSIVSEGDPVVAIDGESVAHLDFEHVVQRLRLLGARATESSPHALTVMVTPAALARAKVIMRAELEHTRREEILARFSSSGLVGLDGNTVKIHDDSLAMAQSLVKEKRPAWRSTMKAARNFVTRGTSTFAEIAAAEAARAEGSPEWKHRRQVQILEAAMRTRRSSYADAAGYKGLATVMFGSSPTPSADHERATPGQHAESPVPVEITARTSPSQVSTGRRFDPAIYEPVSVPVDEYTFATCRAARGGYALDVEFRRQPVGILLKGVVVQSTVAGASADGIVLPGDVLVRVNVHDLRSWRKGSSPAPAQLVAQATRHVSDDTPLRLRFFRQGETMPVWAAAALGLPLTGDVSDARGAASGVSRDTSQLDGLAASTSGSQHRAASTSAAVTAALTALDGVFRPTPNGARVAGHTPSFEIMRHVVEEDLGAGAQGRDVDDAIAQRVQRDVLLDVSFSAKPFGILLKGLSVAGVINGTQAADILRPGDRIMALNGILVWSQEMTSAGGVGRVLQVAAASVTPEKPFVMTFLRPHVEAEPLAEGSQADGADDTGAAAPPNTPTAEQSAAESKQGWTAAKAAELEAKVKALADAEIESSTVGRSADGVPNGAGALPEPAPLPAAGGMLLRRQNTGLEEMEQEVDELNEALQAEQAAAAPALASVEASNTASSERATTPGVPRGRGRVVQGEEGGYDTETSAWTSAAPGRAGSASRAGSAPRSVGTPADGKRALHQFTVTFTAVPYFIKFVEGDRDPETHASTGVYVYKVKRDTRAAEYLRGGDKLVSFRRGDGDDVDVSHMTLSDVNLLLSAEEKIPTEDTPSYLTFHRLAGGM